MNGRREELRGAVRSRLERIGATQNLAAAFEADALAEARLLASVLREDDGDLESRYLLGWLHYYRGTGGQGAGAEADFDAAIERSRGPMLLLTRQGPLCGQPASGLPPVRPQPWAPRLPGT